MAKKKPTGAKAPAAKKKAAPPKKKPPKRKLTVPGGPPPFVRIVLTGTTTTDPTPFKVFFRPAVGATLTVSFSSLGAAAPTAIPVPLGPPNPFLTSGATPAAGFYVAEASLATTTGTVT